MSATAVCNCDHSKRLAALIRKQGDTLESGLNLLIDPRVDRATKEKLFTQLVDAARSMKGCP